VAQPFLAVRIFCVTVGLAQLLASHSQEWLCYITDRSCRRLYVVGVTFHRRNLPHYDSDKAMFVTFATAKRWVLPDEARTIVLECCVFGHTKKYDLYACVVMPDHVHMILAPLVDYKRMAVYSLSEIMNVLKGYSAYRINRALDRTGTVWQDESFDHVLRRTEALEGRIEYIAQNPVRRGLCSAPEEYRWFWRQPPIDSSTVFRHLRP
ncbi:MAG TPA: transposase, partial [Terriglobales bacterium]|nr:transposase [Terriglobales bacterium]